MQFEAHIMPEESLQVVKPEKAAEPETKKPAKTRKDK